MPKAENTVPAAEPDYPVVDAPTNPPPAPKVVDGQKPTLGRIVRYTLSEQDAAEINRRRTTGREIQNMLTSGRWPEGAQAHVGNSVSKGTVVPAIIVAVWGAVCVNLHCVLDGTDSFWATSRNEGALDGQWAWPPRA